jgi:glc operon protein GlcG
VTAISLPKPGNRNGPDGSPLEDRYWPCGLFLPCRTFPSGPLQTVKAHLQHRKSESQFAANQSVVAGGTARIPRVKLNLGNANEVIARAHAKAAELGIRVSVAVVDEGGLLIALARMDGAPPLTPQIAEAKAVGAAMLHRDGASLGELAKDRPGFFNVVDRLVRVPIVPGLGSVLIKRDGGVLGAVGVSGGRPEQDLECAQAGISAA